MRCRRRRLCLFLNSTNNIFKGGFSLLCFCKGDKMADTKGLYIHIPFCERKCAYCDFTSYEGKFSLGSDYCDKIISEIKSHDKYDVDTVYFGGGTPSSVDSKIICRILDCAYSHFNIDKNAEITIEVNPASVTADKLSDYKKSGINRISMGAQSFNDDELKTLGRLHSAQDIYDTYNLIRSCGFDNVSLDLMFGLPNQTLQKLGHSIECMLLLKPEHISCYGLKIEEGTPFYNKMKSGEISPLEDDNFADLYDYVCTRLTDAGYVQYEISNFCLPDKYSRHNSRYWKCSEYIGVGAGASSYIDNVRSKNTDDLLDYKNEVEEILSTQDKMSEFVIFGLRMTDAGISIEEFKNRFGKDIYDVFGKQFLKYERFITRDGDVLKLKRNAYYVSNAILADFIL